MRCHSVCGFVTCAGLVGHSIDVSHTVLFQRIHGEECGITQEPFDLWSSYPGLLLRIVIEVFRCLETQDEFILRMDYVRRVLESI